ncbi:pantoate--beta-alanine ligase [Varunaivibrio sulfuroxidans]|uniref:Pantothenate synthetase n=1 Tax=Varunaivibrio sulfuroxidans TaxID=1773489 RepID=A0A4R3JGI1_9PROT|nr:pantoate--beta-alanine ligase [Varunaivibrio sulfuroxidans]TCS64997.1 pantothenate synthetase [Varunaivibrio sulfuroxidans]WES29713.1 pantoate--beta-alanine ligase [Varunaivibrio sulfuroxidans]
MIDPALSVHGVTVLRSVNDLRQTVMTWRHGGLSIGFVPTMGALHEGHMALVRTARETCDRVIVSIFVNPTQFGVGEDYATYPRDEARDSALLEAHGVHALYAPAVEEIYPSGFASEVSVKGISEVLDGELRHGHFDGVATVVTKLLLQGFPDRAFFGEKDYQQLQIIRRLVTDLNIPVSIEGVATVREADGLALSSRNAYLNADQRKIAPTLHRTLQTMAQRFADGEDSKALSTWARSVLLDAGFDAVDYIEVRDAKTLSMIEDPRRAARVLGAAHLGRARLIDNVPV